MAGTLRFTVEVAADGATKSLNAVSMALNQAGIDGKIALGRLKPAANEASKELGGLETSARALKAEMVQGDRISGFFANKLSSIAPASSMAGEGLRFVGGAILDVMSGLGKFAAIGVGIEAVGLVIKMVTDAIHSQEEQLKAAREAAKQHAEALERIAAIRSETMLTGIAPGTMHDEIALFERTAAAIGKLKREYRDYEDLRDEAARKRDYAGVVRNQQRMDESVAEQKALREQMRAEEKRLDDRKAVDIIHAQDAITLERAVGDETRIRIEYGQRISQIEEEIARKLKDETLGHLEINKLIEERKNKLEEIRNRQESARLLGANTGFAELEAPAFAQSQPILIDANRERASAMALAHARDTTGLPSEGAFNTLEAQGYDPTEVARQQIKAMEDEKRKVEETAKAYEKYGDTAGNAIGEIIAGHKSLGQAAAQVGQLIIQQVVKTAIASITADAARAGAGAAAAEAGIPVIGPVLAVSAMGAIMTQVLGLLGKMPSAAGGWEVPYDTLAMVHKDEKILPAKKSKKLDQLLDSGGGGGGDTYYIQTWGPRDMGAALMDRNSDVAKAQRRAARRRRTV